MRGPGRSPFRQRVRVMQGYVPGEQPRDRRYVKLNTNENPYPPSPRVIEALRDAVGESLRLYPRPLADELRERAARSYHLAPENVLVGNGSDELLSIVMRAVVEPGEPVAYPVPTYVLYDTLVELHDGEPVRIPFAPDFSLPPELVEAPARLVIVCNPNSPSGTMIPPRALRPLCAARERLVVIDEAYVDFADANCLDLLGEFSNVLVLRTLSKSYSLAGMRIGLALGAAAAIAELAKVKDSYNVNRLSIAAGAAALRDGRWMEANVRRIRRTRESLSQGLVALGFSVPPSQANFVLARRPGENLAPLYEGLKRRGVLVRYFPTPDLYDALRITVGTDEEVAVMLRVLAQLLG
ncbi:MAG: histidinol-phosphate transaminase [Deltaproteobacteria bacterium]|nr:histidinol-phosphate transaminase [Deltaproteobacteria bacterium]